MAEKCDRGVINDCVYGTVVVTDGESENLTNFGFFFLIRIVLFFETSVILSLRRNLPC